MARDEFPIDDPDDEIPPANPARRRAATLTGCLFLIVVLGFIIWFAAENNDAPEERPSIFGFVLPGGGVVSHQSSVLDWERAPSS